MRNNHPDHTADRAIGAVSREWQQMVRLAADLRNGRYPLLREERERAKFTGIYRRLLTDPLADLEEQLAGKEPASFRRRIRDGL